MQNSSKMIMGFSLLAYTMLQSGNLESYIKEYEPQEYKSLVQKGVNISELELSSPNKNQNEDSPTIKSVGSIEDCANDGGILLNNNIISTCVSKNGTFGNGSNYMGMIFENADFLRPGTPYEFFSVKFDGTIYHNNNYNGSNNIQNTVISPLPRYDTYNGGVMVSSLITDGDCPYQKGLKIIQKYTLDPNAKELTIQVEMLNIGWLPIHNLYYARGLDPDQDRPNHPYSTYNKRGGNFGGLNISPNNLVQATGTYSNLVVGLYSVDEIEHDTCISSSWTMNPTAIIPCNSISPIYADNTINIAFKLDSLYPGQKKVFSFKYLFEKRYPRATSVIDASSIKIK